jgi:hypothetical protein
MIAQLSSRVAGILVLLALSAGCSEPRDPIVIDEGTITVENMTGSDWKNVRIVVNDHFNGGVPALVAGQRVNAPLSQFQTGLGYRYDRGRMSVYKIEVFATDAGGRPVNLTWGADRPKK